MKKKKKTTNPYKIPLDPKTIDFEAIQNDAVQDMLRDGILYFMAAVAGYNSCTKKQLQQIWRTINKYGKEFAKAGYTQGEIDRNIDVVNQMLGREMPRVTIYQSEVTSEGMLLKYIKQMRASALYAAFTMIVFPAVRDGLFTEEKIKELIDKSYDLHEEVIQRMITMKDIEEMLQDEYKLTINIGK